MGKITFAVMQFQAKPLVKQALENGNFHALVDPSEYNPSEMRRMVACAAACVRNSASNRPNMSQVILPISNAETILVLFV